MTRRRYAALAALVPTLVACASPADVRADHERTLDRLESDLAGADAKLRDDLVTAEAWDQHFLGIPASGWVPLLLAFGLVATGVLIWVIWLVNQARHDRRRKLHELNVESERTRQLSVKRGRCPVCAAEPPTDARWD